MIFSLPKQYYLLLLQSQLNDKISLSFKRDFENDHSKPRILVDFRLENQIIWHFVLTSTILISERNKKNFCGFFQVVSRTLKIQVGRKWQDPKWWELSYKNTVMKNGFDFLFVITVFLYDHSHHFWSHHFRSHHFRTTWTW